MYIVLVVVLFGERWIGGSFFGGFVVCSGLVGRYFESILIFFYVFWWRLYFFNEKVLGSMFKILDDNIVVLFINILFIKIF